MTAPTSGGDQSQESRPRYRAGQVVTFRTLLNDVEVAGHALVLRLLNDVAHLAVLGAGGGHVQLPVDQLTPSSVGDVPNPLPAPTEPAEGSAS